MSKIGVLLVNLGTPDEPTRSAVYRYLKQFLLDRRVIDINAISRNALVRGIIAPFRSGSSAKLYQQLWTKDGSPIKHYGFELEKGVQQKLGDRYIVELAMRYQSPSIESKLTKLIHQDLIEELIIIPLFPQYASATSGSVMEEVMRCLSKMWTIPSIKMMNSFHTNEAMIDIFVRNAQNFDLKQYDHFLFSFHGLPQRQLVKSDVSQNHCLKSEDCCQSLNEKNKLCYSAQSYHTAGLIAKKLNIVETDYTVCFQSRLGRDPWTKPYTSEVLESLVQSGSKNVLVFSPAFVADCLETTIEIGVEYQEDFHKWGGQNLDLVPSLNTDPLWIEAVANMVQEA